jgi:uncharacterized nucleotidyltransferase DUF6036
MTREQLEHILRAASRIVNERDVLVIGSQSILGAFDDAQLPKEVIMSEEADIAFLDDDLKGSKAGIVEGAIGEISPFHQMNKCYAQGADLTTAKLPEGWQDRLVVLDTPNSEPGRGLCLEPHDCVIAKLVAGREKDFPFADALIRAGLIDPDVLAERIGTVDVHPKVIAQVRTWIKAYRR